MSDGKDCTCAAWSENECACGADWTPLEVITLRARVAELEVDAARLEWLIQEYRVMSLNIDGNHAWVSNFRGNLKGPTMRDAIDAAMGEA